MGELQLIKKNKTIYDRGFSRIFILGTVRKPLCLKTPLFRKPIVPEHQTNTVANGKLEKWESESRRSSSPNYTRWTNQRPRVRVLGSKWDRILLGVSVSVRVLG